MLLTLVCAFSALICLDLPPHLTILNLFLPTPSWFCSHLCVFHHSDSSELLFLHLCLKILPSAPPCSFTCSLQVTLSPDEDSSLTTYHLPATDSSNHDLQRIPGPSFRSTGVSPLVPTHANTFIVKVHKYTPISIH